MHWDALGCIRIADLRTRGPTDPRDTTDPAHGPAGHRAGPRTLLIFFARAHGPTRGPCTQNRPLADKAQRPLSIVKNPSSIRCLGK